MKRLISLFLAVMALSLTACGKTTSSSPGMSDGSGNVSEASGNIIPDNGSAPMGGENVQPTAPTDSALTLLCIGQQGFLKTGCGTKDGYYSIEGFVASDRYAHITYIDYASGQEVILCSDSSCKHDTERCTSVIEPSVSGMFFYKEHLYYYASDWDSEGVMSAGSSFGKDDYDYGQWNEHMIQAALYRMNPDGTGRELVYTFGENDIMEGFAVGDENCIWFITKELDLVRDEKTGATLTTSKNRALVKLDPDERRIVEQIPIYYNDNINKSFIGVCGTRLIFAGIAYPGGKSKLDYMEILAPSPTVGDTSGMAEYSAFMSKCEYTFFALDISDKSMKEIYRGKFDDIGLDYNQVGDRLYIPTGKDYTSAFALDLNTGSTDDFPVPEGYKLDDFVGDRPLYITNGKEYKRYFQDPDTGEMKKWVLESEYNTGEVIAINGDNALVVYDTVGEPVPGGGVRNPVDLYALMSLDDLYNGRANFKPIQMLERNTYR